MRRAVAPVCCAPVGVFVSGCTSVGELQIDTSATVNGRGWDEIERVEVAGAGRCTMGDLTRFTAQPGDCIKRIQVATSPHINFVKK